MARCTHILFMVTEAELNFIAGSPQSPFRTDCAGMHLEVPAMPDVDPQVIGSYEGPEGG